ncbi:MAG: hypothetical protein QM608_22945 [Caulobacter sp.]
MEEILDETPQDGFLKTAAKVARSGFAMLKPDALGVRIEACKACPLSIKTASALTCSACGCDMNIKARFAATACPLHSDW